MTESEFLNLKGWQQRPCDGQWVDPQTKEVFRVDHAMKIAIERQAPIILEIL